jgi:hypothetical protein
MRGRGAAVRKPSLGEQVRSGCRAAPRTIMQEPDESVLGLSDRLIEQFRHEAEQFLRDISRWIVAREA